MDNSRQPECNEDGSKLVEMKLTTPMLTNIGFTSLNLGHEALAECETEKPDDKKYYVGISGGGWRALAGHMGVFRVLSNKGTLQKVDMFSSVSGGTWFLAKLAFDNDFAEKVLGNESISKFSMEWLESHYFPAIRKVTGSRPESNDDVVRSFLTTIATHGPDPISSMLGEATAAAEHFNFSWQQMVERSGNSNCNRSPNPN